MREAITASAATTVHRRNRVTQPIVWHRALALFILLVGVWAYHNSFAGVFLFDDFRHIVYNPQIRDLARSVLATTRPLITLSLALNYAIGGLNVFGYHLVNLAIHLASGLVLFGLLRRTFSTPRLAARFGAAAPWLALSIALIWTVHPLQTQSVTYIVQRAESLAGLCALLTLYAAVRSVGSPRRTWWEAAAILSCALGMMSKPIMVIVPLLVLLYDRAFLSPSASAGDSGLGWGEMRSSRFGEMSPSRREADASPKLEERRRAARYPGLAWRAPSIVNALQHRRGLYAGVAATWGVLLGVLSTEFGIKHPSAGFGIESVTPLGYFLTQPGVILYYLRLTFWPHPLLLDYLWPVAHLDHVIVPLLIVGGLVWLTVRAWRRDPALGFLGVWFFLTLAPSSSIMPITDLAGEQRMYLPLAAVVSLVVVGGYALLIRFFALQPRVRQGIATCVVTAAVAGLGVMTIRRNEDYRSEEAMWRSVLVQRPDHFRAHSSLGDVFRRQGRLDESIAQFTEALRLLPGNPEAHYNLGYALVRAGKIDEAIAQYTEAILLRPEYETAHNNLGIALMRQGRLREAIAHYTEAIRLEPEDADAHFNFANALLQQGRTDEAIVQYTDALQLQPDYADYAEAHNTLGTLLARQGKLDEAAAHYASALKRQPDYAPAHINLGNVLAQRGQIREAIAHYEAALRLHPDELTIRNLEAARAQLRGNSSTVHARSLPAGPPVGAQ